MSNAGGATPPSGTPPVTPGGGDTAATPTGGPVPPAGTGPAGTGPAGSGPAGSPPPRGGELRPTVFGGRYELQRRLARGGMADVYLATDTLLNRPVAVKVLFPEYARDETFVERFRREAQAAARLTHGNIVAIHDWGEEFGTYFIVMEYVEGRSLSEVIRAEGPLPPRQAAEIAARVAAALDFAHRHDVVHRDVKPGNIMISTVGEVKVADFGIAQALNAGDRVSLTQTGAVMGTATYFSPEQAQGRTVDQRSDLYSLGCVLYEMLTGVPPFAGETPVAVAYKHVQEPIPPMASHGVAIPAPLVAIVDTLLRKDPEHRYADAADVETDLKRFLAGQQVGATAAAPVVPRPAVATGAAMPPGPGTVAPRRVGGRGWAVALLILGLVVVALGLFLLSRTLSPTDTTEVIVPPLVNRTLAEAEELLADADLTATVTREVNENVAEGVVFDQNPSAGTTVATGAEVALKVSSGVGEVEVPDVVGRTEAEATRILSAVGLGSRSEFRADNNVEEGRVIIQNPPAGSRLARREAVTIIVSSGRDTIPLPNLVDQSESSAANQLGQLRLTVAVERQFSVDVPEGIVIATNPGAGTELREGDTVVLIVSRGPEPTTTTAAPPTSSSSTSSTTP